MGSSVSEVIGGLASLLSDQAVDQLFWELFCQRGSILTGLVVYERGRDGIRLQSQTAVSLNPASTDPAW